MACQQLSHNIGDLAQFHNVSLGRVLLGQIHLDRANLCANLVVGVVGILQGLELVFAALDGDEGLAAQVVEVREVHLVHPGRVGGITGHRQVNILGSQLHQGAVEVHGDDLQLQAQVIGNVLRQRHIKASQRGVALLVQGVEFVGCKVGAGGHGQHAGGNGFNFLLFFGVTGHCKQAANHGQCQNQSSDFLHGVLLL